MPILVQNVPPPWTCAIFVRDSRAHSSQHVAMAANDNGFGKQRAEVANCSRVAVASGWLQRNKKRKEANIFSGLHRKASPY